jgi:hypothetical protein
MVSGSDDTNRQSFQAATKLGITIVVAAGDNGATDGVNDKKSHVDFPASSLWGYTIAQLLNSSSIFPPEYIRRWMR